MTKLKNNTTILNLIASLSKYLGGKVSYDTDLLVDLILEKKPKHVAIVLLDGLGMNVLNTHCEEKSILKTSLVKEIMTVYPSTTSAATISVQTGVDPLTCGWLGWHTYLDDQNKSIILFRNETYEGGEKITDFTVDEKIGFTKWYDRLRKASSYEIGPDWHPNGYSTFKEEVENLKEIFSKDEMNFTYLYYNNPDHLIHENGVSSQVVKDEITMIEDTLVDFQSCMTDDDIIFVIADHGLIDVERKVIEDYPSITSLLRKPISGDERFVQFYLKNSTKDDEFVEEFNKVFGDSFRLYKKADFIKEFKTSETKVHPITKYSLGDYCAVAVANVTIALRSHTDKPDILAHHAGYTEEEMKVPLCVIRKRIIGKN